VLEARQAQGARHGQGQEGVGAARGVDLETARTGRGIAPAVETMRVGDHQRIGLDVESDRWRQAQPRKLVWRDPERVSGRITVAPAGAQTLLALPGQARRSWPLRSRDEGEGSVARVGIAQEQPRLHGGMKGIGVQILLRIVSAPVLDALQGELGPPQRRRAIAQQVDKRTALEQGPAFRQLGERASIEEDAQGRRVTLDHLAHLGLAGCCPRAQAFEGVVGQEILEHEVALSQKAAAQVCRRERRQQPPAQPGRPMRQADARGVQAPPVEGGAAQQRIALEGFSPAEELQNPNGPQQETRHSMIPKRAGRAPATGHHSRAIGSPRLE